jgi:cephalosporin hydroxylase/TolA-binding protein
MTTPNPAWEKKSYYEVYKNHHGFASFKWIHYFFIYDQIFERFLNAKKPVTLLEIGVQNGGSLEVWKKYLPPGSEIHGMDINHRCREIGFSENIHFHLGSAADIKFVNELFAHKNFDIILDDGSHICHEVISTFTNLFKKLNPGGAYIVEDMHTSYDPSTFYGGGLRRPDSHIEFFKGFVDTLHIDYIDRQGPHPADLTPFLSMYYQEIANISFYDSICAITKFWQPKEERFRTTVSGEIFKAAQFDQDKLPQLKIENMADTVNATQAMYQHPAAGQPPAPKKTPDDFGPLDRLYSQGIEAFNLGCYPQAKAIFVDLLYRAPQNPLSVAWIAFVCAREGNVPDALHLMAQFVRAAPGDVALRIELGKHFLQSGNPDAAVAYLREVIAEHPALWQAYHLLAQSLHLSGQSAAAISVIDNVINRAPTEAKEKFRAVMDAIKAEGNAGGGNRSL